MPHTVYPVPNTHVSGCDVTARFNPHASEGHDIPRYRRRPSRPGSNSRARKRARPNCGGSLRATPEFQPTCPQEGRRGLGERCRFLRGVPTHMPMRGHGRRASRRSRVPSGSNPRARERARPHYYALSRIIWPPVYNHFAFDRLLPKSAAVVAIGTPYHHARTSPANRQSLRFARTPSYINGYFISNNQWFIGVIWSAPPNVLNAIGPVFPQVIQPH